MPQEQRCTGLVTRVSDISYSLDTWAPRGYHWSVGQRALRTRQSQQTETHERRSRAIGSDTPRGRADSSGHQLLGDGRYAVLSASRRCAYWQNRSRGVTFTAAAN